MLRGLPTTHTTESRIAYYRQVISRELKYRTATGTVGNMTPPSENVMRMAFAIGKGKPFAALTRELKAEISHIRDNYVKNLKGVTRKMSGTRSSSRRPPPTNLAHSVLSNDTKAPGNTGRSKTTRDAQRDTQDGSSGNSPDATTGDEPFSGWFPELAAALENGFRLLGVCDSGSHRQSTPPTLP